MCTLKWRLFSHLLARLLESHLRGHSHCCQVLAYVSGQAHQKVLPLLGKVLPLFKKISATFMHIIYLVLLVIRVITDENYT